VCALRVQTWAFFVPRACRLCPGRTFSKHTSGRHGKCYASVVELEGNRARKTTPLHAHVQSHADTCAHVCASETQAHAYVFTCASMCAGVRKREDS